MTNNKGYIEFANAISNDLHLSKEHLYTKYAFMAGYCGLTLKQAASVIVYFKSKRKNKIGVKNV